MEGTFELDWERRFSELVDELDLGDPLQGSGLDARHAHTAPSVPVDVFAELESSLDAAQEAQFSANRAMAHQLAAIRCALESARLHPLLYLQPAFAGARDAAELAERAVVAELSMRLRIAEATVRAQAHEAAVLQQQLPRYGLGSPKASVRTSMLAPPSSSSPGCRSTPRCSMGSTSSSPR